MPGGFLGNEKAPGGRGWGDGVILGLGRVVTSFSALSGPTGCIFAPSLVDGGAERSVGLLFLGE